VPAESARSAWTDERLDKRFDRIDERFDRIDERFDRVEERFDGMERRFDRMDERFDGLYRTLLMVGGGMIASILVGTAGIAATQL
jgi:archaellum component FlaC